MKKHVLFISILLVVALAFSSCGNKGVKFADMVGSVAYEESRPTLSNKTSVSALEGRSLYIYDSDAYNYSYGELVFFQNYDEESKKTTVEVYNLEKGSIVLRINKDDIKKISCFSSCGHAFFMVSTLTKTDDTEKKNTTIYDASGVPIVSKNGLYTNGAVYTTADLFQFKNGIYRVNKDGSAALVCDSAFSIDLSSVNIYIKTEDYYFSFPDDGVKVYDHSLNTVMYWELPHDVYDYEMNVLNGGKILVQYVDLLPNDSKKYDLLMKKDGEQCKFNLTSLLIDVEKGKEKELDLDFYVEYVISRDRVAYSSDTEEEWPKGLENYARIYYIRDGYLNDSSYNLEIVSLSSKGKVKGNICSDIEGIVSWSSVANDRYIYKDVNGDRYLVDGDGDKIGKVNNLGDTTPSNESYIVMGGRIYNYNLEVVYDLEESGYEILHKLSHSFILADKDGNHKLFVNGQVVDIEGKVMNTYGSTLYTVLDSGKNKHQLFNDLGTLIIDAESSDDFTFVLSAEDCVLVKFRDSSENKDTYYRISK